MKIIQNKFIPFKGYSAMMLFGFLFTRDKSRVTDTTVRHECIHFRQMIEISVAALLLLVALCLLWLSWWWLLLSLTAYYIIYGAEWLVRLFMKGNAYRNISFEREAYGNETDVNYLKNRKLFAWIEYL